MHVTVDKDWVLWHVMYCVSGHCFLFMLASSLTSSLETDLRCGCLMEDGLFLNFLFSPLTTLYDQFGCLSMNEGFTDLGGKVAAVD